MKKRTLERKTKEGRRQEKQRSWETEMKNNPEFTINNSQDSTLNRGILNIS